MPAYTGIGSRQTPKEVKAHMASIATYLGREGFILRSGGADGADTAFESGCDSVNGNKEIFRPTDYIPQWAFDTVASFHPNPRALTKYGRRLMARNALQVFGRSSNDPTELIICWTLGGSGKGGTGQAIRIARRLGIPVVDLGKGDLDDHLIEIHSIVSKVKGE
jgi:hypothetical protein